MLRARRFLQVELLYAVTLSAIMIFLGFLPVSSFDDVFMKETGLLPYIDFRPGYPPLGKSAYHFLYSLFSRTSVYSFFAFFFNLTALLLLSTALYLCISKLQPRRAFTLALLFMIMPSVIYFSVTHAHADTLAVAAMLFALYFIDHPWVCGALCGVGTLTKFYPASLLLPLLIYYKGVKKKVSLLYSFIFVVLLLSIPFLLADPLMYLSVAISHTLRGPSESIFSLIDGYYGHTGFLHPTFDATIYSWQFAAVYNQSSYDHFRYLWKIPALPYISLGLQMIFMITISWIAKKRKDQKESMMFISLAIFSYFAFSTFYNPIIHLIQIPFMVLATLNWDKRAQIGMIFAFETVNIVHSLVWFTPIFLYIGTQLPLALAVVLRTILYVAVFLNFAKRRTA